MKHSTKIIALVAALLTVNGTAAVAEQKGTSGELLPWVSRLYGVKVGGSAVMPAQQHALKAAHQRGKSHSSFAPLQLPAGISFSLGSETSGQAAVGVSSAYTAAPAEKTSVRMAADTTARFGDYYAILAVDYDLPRPMVGAGEKNRKGSALDVSATAKVKGLATGINYARRNEYQPGVDQKMSTGLPYHIFTTGKGEDAYEQDGYALFFSVGYDVTEKLNMNGTLGYAKVKNRAESDASPESRRWGVDIGASYRLLDNLYYDAHLGYVTLDGPPEAPAPQGNTPLPLASDPAGGNFYHMINQLRMTF